MWNCNTLLITPALNYVLKAPIATTWATGWANYKVSWQQREDYFGRWVPVTLAEGLSESIPSKAELCPRPGSHCRFTWGVCGHPSSAALPGGAPACIWWSYYCCLFPQKPTAALRIKTCRERKVHSNNAIAHTHTQRRKTFVNNSAFIYVVSMVLLCQTPSVLSPRQSFLTLHLGSARNFSEIKEV